MPAITSVFPLRQSVFALAVLGYLWDKGCEAFEFRPENGVHEVFAGVS
jgi:hypothetical protein